MGNINLVLVILIVLVFVWAISINKQPQEKYSASISENLPQKYSTAAPLDNRTEDAYEILGVNNEQEAFDLGFGMGPGIYGSGRHFSEMVIL